MHPFKMIQRYIYCYRVVTALVVTVLALGYFYEIQTFSQLQQKIRAVQDILNKNKTVIARNAYGMDGNIKTRVQSPTRVPPNVHRESPMDAGDQTKQILPRSSVPRTTAVLPSLQGRNVDQKPTRIPWYPKKRRHLFDPYIKHLDIHFNKTYRFLGQRSDPNLLQQEYNNMSNYWKWVHDGIGVNKKIYQSDFNVDSLLLKMKHSKIVNVTFFRNRPTLKWLLTLEGGQKVLFKPDLRVKSKSCVSGCEHPAYDVTGYAINRMLGLNTMPFTTWRNLEWFKEIQPIAKTEFTENFNKYTTSKNVTYVCIKWKCTSSAPSNYCFVNGRIKGSVMYWINGDILEIENYAFDGSGYDKFHPMYFTGGGRGGIATGLKTGDSRICDLFKQKPPYNDTEHFIHILNIAVEDFLTQSRNSKHTVLYLSGSRDPLMNVIIDKGKGFCSHDDDLLLAPVYQCCKIGTTLYNKLVALSGSFENEFAKKTSLENKDELVSQQQISQIGKRVAVVLSYVKKCIKMKGKARVFL